MARTHSYPSPPNTKGKEEAHRPCPPNPDIRQLLVGLRFAAKHGNSLSKSPCGSSGLPSCFKAKELSSFHPRDVRKNQHHPFLSLEIRYWAFAMLKSYRVESEGQELKNQTDRGLNPSTAINRAWDLGQVTEPLCASVSSSVKQGQ